MERDEYLEQLLRRRGNGQVKVITGLRRCGKSYLLFTLFRGRLLAEGGSCRPHRVPGAG